MTGVRGRYGGPVKANSSLVVTTSDSDQRIRRHADYVCDGVSDQVQIQAAIDKFADAGNYGDVYLTGDFYITSGIRSRKRVALSAVNANHGARLTITAGSDCNGIEIAHAEGKGTTAITGIYIEGNKDNNAAGSGFVMPTDGIRVTNSGVGCSNSTVQVTSTQIIFSREGFADYTITLSDKTGTLISEIIDVVDGNNGWTVTNATGGLPGAVLTAHCTTTPSNALAVVSATDTYTVNADLVLGITYDYFFHQCMCLHPNDYGWWAPKGHSIHFERCVAEYAGVDGFNIAGSLIDGVRMYGCYAALNINNGYTIDATNPILTGCRSGQNEGHGFSMPAKAALLSGCQSEGNDEANKAGFHVVADVVVINGCRSFSDEVGIQIEGSYCAVSGNSIISADTHGIHVKSPATYNAVTGNNVLNSGGHGILADSALNTITGNNVSGSGSAECYDSSFDNVWSGNSEECRFAVRTGATTLTIAGSNSKAAYQSGHAASQVTFQLPAATLGLEFSFAVGVDAQECRIEPSGTETIAIDSVQQAAGKYITANAINEFIKLKCLFPGTWEDVERSGTWTAEA